MWSSRRWPAAATGSRRTTSRSRSWAGTRFDPQDDPIVRIEVGRLRRDLDHYYLTDGRDDPIRITIPKGHYVPCWEAWRTSPGSRLPQP